MGFPRDRSCFSIAALASLALLLLAAAAPPAAYADGVNGFVEFTRSRTDLSVKSGGAETARNETDSFLQRYNLSLDRTLYPYVKVNAGGMFEKSASESASNAVTIDSDATRISPYINLMLGSPFVSSALGYNRNEMTSSSTGASSTTNVLETYNARLGLRPEDLPSLDLRFSRYNSFDKDKVSLDSTADNFALSSRYQPLRELDLTYQGALFNTVDRLNLLETETVTNAVTGSHTRQFLGGRVSSFASFTLSNRETTLSSTGTGGEVVLPIVPEPARGLSAVTPSVGPPPTTVTSGELLNTPQLLDGSARINIVTAITAPPPAVGTAVNLGLQFTDPTLVNTLFLTVASGGNATPFNLIGSVIPARFSWEVYISDNGSDWGLTPVQTITVATGAAAPGEGSFDFSPLATAPNSVGFILPLSIPAARFIKVVVAPPQLIGVTAPEGVDLNNIVVTKIEALERRTLAEGEEQKTSSLSGLLSVGGRARLLDRPHLPSLNYDVNYSYNYNKQDSNTNSTWYLSNGLSSFYAFNKSLSSNARFSREDSSSAQANRTGYSYSVSLDARPLPALSHSLIYSGRRESTDGQSSHSNSLFLRNSAALYRGVGLSLDGGVSLSTNTEGVESQSAILSSGASFIPHPTLTLSLSFTETRSQQSGGGLTDSSSFTRTGGVSASYAPVSSVSLFAALGVVSQTDRDTDITQNFGGSWSPFRDGALLVSIFYNESLSSTGDVKTRVVSPALRWNIRSGWWLDLNYSFLTTEQTSEGLTGETEVSTLSSTLRLSF